MDLELSDATERLARRWPCLFEFDFNALHRTGNKHQAPDTLSRLPTDDTNNKTMEEELPVLVIERGDKMDHTTTTTIALEARKSAATNAVSNADGTYATPSTLPEFIDAQSADEFCQHAARQLCQAGIEFTLSNGVLVGRAIIDGDLQKLVSQFLRQSQLNLSHHSSLSGHSRQRCMYDTMRIDYYWMKIARNVYKAVSSCHCCARSGSTLMHKRHLQLFPRTEAFELAAMDILGPQPKTI